jgi:hypothetical protein
MTVNNKRVFYVKYLAHEIYTEILKARPDVRLDRLENESPDAVAAPILSAAHAYQIGAARDELAKHFHVDQDLLRRAPNLLIVSATAPASTLSMSMPARQRACWSSINPAEMPIPWPSTRSGCC